jgi:hypothetical protein
MNWETVLSNLLSQVTAFGLAAFFWEYLKSSIKKVEDIDRRVLEIELREKIKRENLGK